MTWAKYNAKKNSSPHREIQNKRGYKLRLCLGECGTYFQSEGRENRLCSNCKRKDSFYEEADYRISTGK